MTKTLKQYLTEEDELAKARKAWNFHGVELDKINNMGICYSVFDMR